MAYEHAVYCLLAVMRAENYLCSVGECGGVRARWVGREVVKLPRKATWLFEEKPRVEGSRKIHIVPLSGATDER